MAVAGLAMMEDYLYFDGLTGQKNNLVTDVVSRHAFVVLSQPCVCVVRLGRGKSICSGRSFTGFL